jgi:glycosyltransferase involved in cell wall biosynthesis
MNNLLCYNIKPERLYSVLSDNTFSLLEYNIYHNFDHFNINLCNKSSKIHTFKLNIANEEELIGYIDLYKINIVITNTPLLLKQDNCNYIVCGTLSKKKIINEIYQLMNTKSVEKPSDINNQVIKYENYLNCKAVFPVSINNAFKKSDIIIYILCFNDERYNNALDIYKKYIWAKPILMKYNNFSLENAFWKQLLEIENEWNTYEMVGTLSYSAFKKIDLNKIDNIISNRLYFPNSYYHFLSTLNKIPNKNTMSHPNFGKIWVNFLPKVKLFTSNEAICNYWMCTPILMKQFLNWYINICEPLLINEEYIFSNSNYNPPNYSIDIVKLWGKPYLPHYPFICERLVHTYFVSNFKIVFLISHEKTFTGAPLMLLNMKKIYERFNIKTILLYYPDIIEKNIDIVELIINMSNSYNCSPVVIVNTIVCYPIINKLKNTNILTYWYIHEWIDIDINNSFNNWFLSNLTLLNNNGNGENINLLFICTKQKELYEKHLSNLRNNFVLINKISKNELYKKQLVNQPIVEKQHNTIIISIIGSICIRKNQQNFISDVFYKLINNLEYDIKLYLIGKEYDKLIIDTKYNNKIIKTDEVDNAIPYISMSDIVVSYSLNEVFPLNIIESFYCKKPVVASNVGGVSEIIDDNINGFLFNSNDSNKCYDLLCNLINSEDLRKNIGNKAYNKYLNEFNLDTNCEDYLYILGFN